MRQATIPELRAMLLRRAELLAHLPSPRAVAADVAAGRLHRLRRGWYLPADQWHDLWSESRHRAHVVAVMEDARKIRPIASHISAAAVHELPLYRIAPTRVHVTVDESDRRSIPDVFRHEGSVPEDDIVEIDGIRCTSLARTVFDIARTTAAEVALSCADAALARVGGDPRWFDDDAAEQWRDGLRSRAAKPKVRGIRYARTLIELADGRAQLPLESVTRLHLLRLGFARPRLQVPVPAPYGGRYWLDIELAEADAFYECDGEEKYLNPTMRNGKDLDRVLLEEKQREEWIRGTTGRRVLHGGSAHVTSESALAARLAAFGVRLPSHRTHLLIPSRPLSYGT